MNLPSRGDALMAVITDQQACFDNLDREVRQVLEALTSQPPSA